MRITVTLVVVPLLHELRGGIAQVERHRPHLAGVDVGERLVDRVVAGVGLGGCRHGDRGLGEDDARFGHAHHVDGLGGGDGDLKDLRLRHAHFLTGGDHNAPRDETGVLPRPQHLREVMDGGVRVASPHGFDESGDDIVMLVAVLVVTHGRHVHDGRDHVGSDEGTAGALAPRFVTGDSTRGGLEDRERLARVPTGQAHDLIHRIVIDTHFVGKPLRGVHGAIEHGADVVRLQGLELDDDGTRQERRDNGETGVFRGRRDESDVAVLDAGQQRVLLGFGETMHLVDEQHRLRAFGDEPVMGALEHIAHVLDAGGHGGKLLERASRLTRHDVSERGLAHPGRAEQDDGRGRGV